MADVFVEHRELRTGVALTWDMAHHLYARHGDGPALIISENPPVMLAALRKQWVKVILKLRNEYSRTLDQARRNTVLRIIRQMEALQFATKAAGNGSARGEAGVYIVKPRDIGTLPFMFKTIYITCGNVHESKVAHRVLRRGLIVRYPRDGGSQPSLRNVGFDLGD